jgi:hypothetical protein
VILSPGANLQDVIEENPEGTVFCLQSGAYPQAQETHPRDGDQFLGLPSAPRPSISTTTGKVFEGGENLVYSWLDVGPSPVVGIDPGSGTVITWSVVHDNLYSGIENGQATHNVTIAYNNIHDNGSDIQVGINASGIKWHGNSGTDSGYGALIQTNRVHDNTGEGIWIDCDGHDNLVTGNDVWANSKAQLLDEISYNNHWTNNAVHDSPSTYAVKLVDVMGSELSGNTLSSNAKGYLINVDDRGVMTKPTPGLGCGVGYVPSGLTVHYNKVQSPQVSGYANGVGSGATDIDLNCYGGLANPTKDPEWLVSSNEPVSWGAWQAAGEDVNGAAISGVCP